jgi:hypothetical protein
MEEEGGEHEVEQEGQRPCEQQEYENVIIHYCTRNVSFSSPIPIEV